MTLPFFFIAGFAEKQTLKSLGDFLAGPEVSVVSFQYDDFCYIGVKSKDSVHETFCISNDQNKVVVLLQGIFYDHINLSPIKEKISSPDFDARQLSPVINALNGDFSGIILDREKREITLFTDLLGFSKIFYSTINGSFIVSSSIWPLLQGKKPTLDRTALAEHLALGYAINKKTLYTGINLLIPGELTAFDFKGTLLEEIPFVQHKILSASYRINDLKKGFFGLAEDHFTFIKEKFTPEKWGMTLTGGNDTRVVLNSFLNNGIRPYVFTGYAVSPSASRDCTRAEAISGKYDLVHKSLNYGADPMTKLLQVFILSNGYLNGATISNLADQVDQDIDLMYYGFSGDLVSGGDEFNLKNLGLDEIIARSLNYKTYYKELRLETLLTLVDVPHEAFYDQYSNSYMRYATVGNMNEIYFLQEKNTRNYLRIASFADGSKTGPPAVYFFHDRRILDFYKSIPERLLKNQFLHHKLSYHNNLRLGLFPSANKSGLPSFFIPYLSKIMSEEQTARITRFHTRRRKPASIRFDNSPDLIAFLFKDFPFQDIPSEFSFERLFSAFGQGELLREDLLTLKRRLWEIQLNFAASKNIHAIMDSLIDTRQAI